jgi:hypothetical protein
VPIAAAVTVSTTPRVGIATTLVPASGVPIAAVVVAVAAAGISIAAVVVTIAAAGIPVAAVVIAVVSAGVAVAVAVAVVAVATPIEAIIAIAPGESAAGIAVATSAIVAVIPRAGADEDATHKVVRTVEAIRCAFVRIIVIVTVGANGSHADVARANSNAHRNLSLGVTSRKHENAE